MQNDLDPKGLLPCPFCGSEEIVKCVDDNGDYPQHFETWFECEACDARSSQVLHLKRSNGDIEAEAIAAWNRRHLSATVPAEGELVEGPWKLGGYAPGSYMCVCLTCDQAHEADKRATQCVHCAAREAASRLSQGAGVRVTDEMVERLARHQTRTYRPLFPGEAENPDVIDEWVEDNWKLAVADARVSLDAALSGDTV